MISALVSLYNGERYVIEQLESIRAQTMPVDEVILADDGSTDRTLTVVEAYIEAHSLTHWRLLQNPVNLGPAGNSFALLKQASGRLVFLADQDDVWEPDKVSTVAAHFERHARVVAVASTEVLVDQRGHAIRESRLLRSFGRNVSRFPGWVRLSVADFAGNSSIPWHATCIRKEVIDLVLEAGAPDVRRTLGADWYVGLVACLIGEFHLLGTPLMRRRIHESNASLGRLRRETLLGTDRERRISLIEEVSDAHRYVLESPELASLLTEGEARQFKRIIDWQTSRARFTRGPTPMSACRLLRMIGAYRISLGDWRKAIRGLGADFLYASPVGRRPTSTSV